MQYRHFYTKISFVCSKAQAGVDRQQREEEKEDVEDTLRIIQLTEAAPAVPVVTGSNSFRMEAIAAATNNVRCWYR